MESVKSFLADNYVWFFVAAIVLCFALIGFIIESRKKQKNEFKGESIEESSKETENVVNNPINNTVVTEPVVPINTDSIPVVEPINTVSEPTPSTTITAQEEPVMEINDIPLVTENKPSSIEFYSGPIEMNTPTPEPMPTTNIRDPFEMGTSTNNDVINTPTEETISYEQVPSMGSVNAEQVASTEKIEDTNNNSTF